MQESIAKSAVAGVDNFNFKRMAARIINYWYWYLSGLVAALIMAFLYIRYTPPTYTVHAQVLVKDASNSGGSSSSSSGGANEGFNIFVNDQNNVYNELTILQTADLCSKVVDELELYKTYFYKDWWGDIELYDDLPFTVFYRPYDPDVIDPVSMNIDFRSSKNKNGFKISVGDSSFTEHFNDTFYLPEGIFCLTKTGSFKRDGVYTFTVSSPEDVANEIVSSLSAEVVDEKTSVINLYYATSIPAKGEDILNQIIKSYIERNLDEKNQLSDSTLDFIDSRIALVGGDLSHIESNIQHFKQQNKIADLPAQSQQLISDNNNYNQQIATLSVQLQVIQTMLAYLQDNKNDKRPVPALLNTDPTFQSLTENYNSLQIQRDKLLLSFKANNSIIQNLDNQIENIRESMVRSLKSQQNALNVNLEKLITLNSQTNALITNVPVKERRFLDLSRQRDVEQSLYLFLLQKKEETAIAKASNIPNVSIIESPKIYNESDSPSATRIYTIAALLGLAIPFGIVKFRFVFNNKVMTREDVSNSTPVPMLAEIGHNNSKEPLVLDETCYSMIAEQFRIFRTNLKLTTTDKTCKVILVTSATRGEGKSFVSVNLARICAITGKKVLLMELDLRLPKLAQSLGITTKTGFTNYITSSESILDCISAIPGVANYYILPAGPKSLNPAELLLTCKFQTTMQTLKQEFDIIIIDAPPIGAVTDAQILGDYSDVSLYIVRQNHTYKDNLEMVNDIVENTKLPNVYLVLNDVKKRDLNKYSYGFNSDYRYNHSYIENKKKNGSLLSKTKRRIFNNN